MIHGPCGHFKPNAQCMKNFVYSKGYPKPFAEYTVQGNDSYPVYRRRDDNSRTITVGRGVVVDNRWVVPYNSWLLLRYDCHINVEICSSIKSIKYLYKYVYKGHDCVSFEVRPAPNYDEVSKYVDGRWVCAPEALWKIFKFEMTRMYPSVSRLQIHLPNQHQVHFGNEEMISTVLANERNSKSMLTEFFRAYNDDHEREKYLYKDFPKYYRYLSAERKWIPRVSTQKVIGRIYAVNPMEGERFYLRLLLNHVKGPKSFEDLKCTGGVQCTTFKQAAEQHGLLEEDNSIRDCLAEARCFRMPNSLRRLFATILLYCEPTSVQDLWDENFDSMTEDYTSSSTSNSSYQKDNLLHDLDDILQQHKKTIKDFGLPAISEGFEGLHLFSSLIEHERSFLISDDDLNSVNSFNPEQLSAFNIISASIRKR
ncbi:hypothetical protein KSP39_PZI016221 [Platanthera zijinensis]|uniref:Uncharacterized protein n=1 Tax=Platanthera zijinensis TaxID=2320716 RepID=A0AAP0B7P0_9ASPA